MAGKHGVQGIKSMISVVKLGAISILQNIQRDGFQSTDLFAPLASQTFMTELEKAKDQFVQVLPELGELDGKDLWELGTFAVSVFKDVKTELSPAFATLKRLQKVA